MKQALLPEVNELRSLESLRARTPARLLVGRVGTVYRTTTQLQLRLDHAVAQDAVHAELDSDWLKQQRLAELRTLARTKEEYLLQPALGRRLRDEAKRILSESCPKQVDLQIAVGDGLSATAVAAQVPALLPLLIDGARRRGWATGQPFALRYCRVGVLNDIGDVLQPRVVVLLIGERPGLATAESLSAYMAYRPQAGHTDAQRNLISNIHARGVGHADAARRILALAEQMMQVQTSGVAVKESLRNLGQSELQMPK